MIRKTVTVALSVITVFLMSVNAQKAEITFDKKVHDFGQIKEDGGNVTFTFEFTNTGKEPLIIHRVNASCGCTSPDWTKTPIEPGKKGQVTATYNPFARPGAFSKLVFVYSNSTNDMEQLTIKGTVIPKSAASEKK